MKLEAQCIPCLVRQAYNLVSKSVDAMNRDMSAEEDEPELPAPDPFHLMTDMLELMAHLPLEQYTAPEVAAEIQHQLIQATGVDDPYQEDKRRMNAMMLELLPHMRQAVQQDPDPLRRAVLLAARGNLVDLAPGGYDPEAVMQEITGEEDHVCTDDMEILRRAVRHADKILYLHDNAGEIVADRLLIERLPLEKVTSVVRGAPVINDATMEDAEAAGITNLVNTITTGAAIPGISVPDSSLAFVREFVTSDLVIAKGQGNYETLSGMKEIPILFIFKAKCEPVARRTGCTKGSTVIMANDYLKGKIAQWEED